MGKFRKKPVVIEAERLTASSWSRVADWCGGQFVGNRDGETFSCLGLNIETLEGVMFAEIGDWILKGVKGEFYPCKPDIFEATYEPVNDHP